jgi:hypothetical protein
MKVGPPREAEESRVVQELRGRRVGPVRRERHAAVGAVVSRRAGGGLAVADTGPEIRGEFVRIGAGRVEIAGMGER